MVPRVDSENSENCNDRRDDHALGTNRFPALLCFPNLRHAAGNHDVEGIFLLRAVMRAITTHTLLGSLTNVVDKCELLSVTFFRSFPAFLIHPQRKRKAVFGDSTASQAIRRMQLACHQGGRP
jgi:hypothetical protein